jgi:hypothetical protein
VREERLRATAGLRPSTLTLSSWRGRSGRRYIVGIHPVAEAEIAEVSEAIIIAVRRDAEGTAHVIDIATAGAHPNEQARARWASAMRSRGATEMHVHRLANGDQERRAIVDDLREDESRAS